MPNTYYHNSANRPFEPQSIKGNAKFDVAIIGGGFTGLGAGLELAQSGVKVCILEAYEIGHGASGRNGGLVCTGFRHEQKWFEEQYGNEFATAIWKISSAAKQSLKEICNTYQIAADYKSGLVIAAHNKAMLNFIYDDAENLAHSYNYNDIVIIMTLIFWINPSVTNISALMFIWAEPLIKVQEKSTL